MKIYGLTEEEFFQTRKDSPVLPCGTPRDFVCEVSDLIQKYFGKHIWAKLVLDNAKQGHSTIVIDDWRRPTELEYLKSQPNVNLLTVYLDKENHNKTSSSISSSYEGLINKEDCDFSFTYTSDYSNFEQLVSILSHELKK